VILFAVVLASILSIFGLVGNLRVSVCPMFVHAFFCTSILGAFYIYLLLDAFLKESEDAGDRMSDWKVLLLMSIPFLLIFLVGCHAMYLLNLVFDENKARKEEKRQIQPRIS
jgi:hypothetical protein